MIPVLFPANSTQFFSQGLGTLTDVISCVVREERNGAYELEMQYPLDGIHFEEITDRCIIYAIPSPYRDPQPFRIYRITKPLNGIVTIYAQHISYDLSGIPLNPFTANSVSAAMAGLSSNAETDCPFIFWTDKSTKANFTVSVPNSIRSVLGGQEGSVLDVYGGEYEWDGFTVKLYNQRGRDNGVVIRYGKNLIDLKQDRNISDVATGIYPYWKDTEGNLVTCNPKIISAPGTYDFTRVVPVDFSSEWQEAPTPEQLQARAETYVKSNNIGVPKVSITASFAQLEQYEPYTNMALLEKCDLCDTVTVQFEKLGVDAKAEIVSIETDVLLERYNSVEIGEARSTISDTIISQQQEIQKLPTTTAVQQAVSNATDWITNGKGYVVVNKNAAGQATEILVMDTPDIDTAQKVWRWNNGGFGHSKTGYNGPYTTAITQDGHIVADFVDVGTLTANIIKTGVLQSKEGNTYFNLDTGDLIADYKGSQVRLRSAGSSALLLIEQGKEVGSFFIAGAGGENAQSQVNADSYCFGAYNPEGNVYFAYTNSSGETSLRADVVWANSHVVLGQYKIIEVNEKGESVANITNFTSENLTATNLTVSNGTRTNLYWEEITLDDGRKTHVLCGWDEVQS